MAAIGYVNRQTDGSYKGFLNTLSIRRSIVLLANRDKEAENQPDFRDFTDDRERVDLGTLKPYGVEVNGREIRLTQLADRRALAKPSPLIDDPAT
jgi:uncharacterized protein (DUF736 family)